MTKDIDYLNTIGINRVLEVMQFWGRTKIVECLALPLVDQGFRQFGYGRYIFVYLKSGSGYDAIWKTYSNL